MASDPGVRHADDPADHHPVSVRAKTHRRRTDGGSGQGLSFHTNQTQTDRSGVSMRKVGIGVIGCGVISKAYMTAMKQFEHIELRAVADMRTAPAEARAKEFGVPGMRVDQMLKRDDIEIVVNLTVPLAHTDVSLAALNAGKHVHSEKPLGVNMVEARKVMDLAAQRNLRVGCAPDTFLGGGHQTARKLIDDGAIGTPAAGTASLMLPAPHPLHPPPASSS